MQTPLLRHPPPGRRLLLAGLLSGCTMGTVEFTVKPGTIDEALSVEAQIPEFGGAYPASRYTAELGNRPHLILVAEAAGELIGYKVGFEVEPGVFYSWLDCLTPDRRRHGIARDLLHAQERWVTGAGFHTVRVRSKNRYPQMLIMLISDGYEIVDVEGTGADAKIVFEKKITPRP